MVWCKMTHTIDLMSDAQSRRHRVSLKVAMASRLLMAFLEMFIFELTANYFLFLQLALSFLLYPFWSDDDLMSLIYSLKMESNHSNSHNRNRSCALHP